MHPGGNKKYLWRSSIILLVAAIGAVTFFWLSQSELLAIEDIEVDGNRTISTEEVLDRVGPLLRGQSLLSASFDDADRLISQLPYTESVDVERDFPHAVRIHIREYRPFVNLKAADAKVFILSAEARALNQTPGLAPEYPVLATRQPCAVEVGQFAECPEAKNGVWFLANIPVSFNQEFAEVMVADDDITAKTKTGVSVHFGSLEDYVLKFEVLRQLLTRTGAAGTTIALDVSVPERPVTRDNTATVSTSTTATTEQVQTGGESPEQTPETNVDAQAPEPETTTAGQPGEQTYDQAGVAATSPAP